MKNRPASSPPADVVAPVHEVVAAAEHPDPVVLRRVHHADVRIDRDDRAVARWQLEVGLAELVAA